MTEARSNISEEVPAPLGIPHQVAYGIGQIAVQTFRDVPSFLLLFFMTSLLGVAPAIAGAAIFLPKLFGGIVFDAAAGVFSDRWLASFKRRNWLLAGALAAPAAIVALFAGPDGSAEFHTAYIAIVFTLYMAVFASFSIPYLAIAADLNLSSRGRSVLMAWRMVFISIGILVAGALAPAFVDTRGGDRAAYFDMAVLLGVISAVSLGIAWLGARAAEAKVGIAVRPAEPRLTWALLGEAMTERRFALLAPVTLLQLSGVGMAYAALLYFLTYNMGSANAYNEIGIVVLLASAAIIVGQPIWLKLSALIGRGQVYIVASLLHAAANIGWGFSTEMGMTAMYIFAFLLGIGSSGWALMGHTILIDIASGGRTGVYTSSWMAIDKIGFALGGTLLLGAILSFWSFDAERAAQGLSQPPSALTGILVGFAIIPALVNVAGAAIFAIFGRDI